MHIDRAAATVAEGFVPVVDLSSRCTAEGRAALARAIDAACTGSGFFVIVGHGIPPGTQTPAGIWPENPPESAGVPEGPAGAHDGHGHATGHCSPSPSTTTPRSSPRPCPARGEEAPAPTPTGPRPPPHPRVLVGSPGLADTLDTGDRPGGRTPKGITPGVPRHDGAWRPAQKAAKCCPASRERDMSRTLTQAGRSAGSVV